ncbi:MAG: hypothetical protein U9R25_03815 [Chloroflexota bacterium]|nr:hypothetical protein [Chloroflexota bacterium]
MNWKRTLVALMVLAMVVTHGLTGPDSRSSRRPLQIPGDAQPDFYLHLPILLQP